MILEITKNVFGLVLNEYTNGYDTTAGFVDKKSAKNADGTVSLTYDSEHSIELPINWLQHKWLDDNNKRQNISQIRYYDTPAYLMQDGTLSNTVTY